MNGISNHKAQVLSLILGVKMTYLSFSYLFNKYWLLNFHYISGPAIKFGSEATNNQ